MPPILSLINAFLPPLASHSVGQLILPTAFQFSSQQQAIITFRRPSLSQLEFSSINCRKFKNSVSFEIQKSTISVIKPRRQTVSVYSFLVCVCVANIYTRNLFLTFFVYVFVVLLSCCGWKFLFRQRRQDLFTELESM